MAIRARSSPVASSRTTLMPVKASPSRPHSQPTTITQLLASRPEAIKGASLSSQLPFPFGSPSPSAQPPRPATVVPALPKPERLAHLDQRMSTADVLRVVGVNRSTLFRWTKKGRFPAKHASGGWLRSDVERWLTAKMDADAPRNP